MNEQETIDHLAQYVYEAGRKPNSQWYAGIDSDVEQRLFHDHNVNKDNGSWAYAPADSPNSARNVERYFLNNGFSGGTGGGDDTTSIVYVYLKTFETDP